MNRYSKPAGIMNRTYQQRIAMNLVKSLGLDDAIDACSQNGWTGTLNIILKNDKNYR